MTWVWIILTVIVVIAVLVAIIWYGLGGDKPMDDLS